MDREFGTDLEAESPIFHAADMMALFLIWYVTTTFFLAYSINSNLIVSFI